MAGIGIDVPRRAPSRLAGVAAAGVLVMGLAGCAGSPGEAPSDGTSISAPAASSAPEASPSTTDPAAALPEDEARAFREATATVLAYRQTVADLYSGARTDFNDLDDVATGDLLDRDLTNVSTGVWGGYRSVPLGAQMVLVDAEPVSVDLDAKRPTVVVRACIDATAITDVAPDGTETRGLRERSDFHVSDMTLGGSPEWRVARVTGESKPEDRAC